MTLMPRTVLICSSWGLALDNIFVEQLWRSIKEEVYLNDYEMPKAAVTSLR